MAISSMFELTQWFDPVRGKAELCEADISQVLHAHNFTSKYSTYDDVPESALSELLQHVFPNCQLNRGSSQKLLEWLSRSSLRRNVVPIVLTKAIRFWSRKDTSRRFALLIVDVQNDFISGSLALSNAPLGENGAEVIPVINALRDSVEFHLTVLSLDWHTDDHCSFASNVSKHALHSSCCKAPEECKVLDTVVYDGEVVQEQVLWPDHCVQGSEGAQIHKDLHVKESDVRIFKGEHSHIDSYSAFWDNGKLQQTPLLLELLDHNITSVYVVGLATDYCVGMTALDAAELGFETYLVEDACRSIAADSKAAMMAKARLAGVKIISAAQVSETMV